MNIDERKYFLNSWILHSYSADINELGDLWKTYRLLCQHYKGITENNRFKEAVGGVLTAIEFMLDIDPSSRND
jgi:hypothetical protein